MSRVSIAARTVVIVVLLLLFSGCADQDRSSNSRTNTNMDNVKIAKKMYEHLLAGNMEEAFKLMSDDIRWTYYGNGGGIPFSGDYIGHKGVGEFFADYASVAEPLGMELESFASSGNKVFVTGVEKSKVISNGQTYAAPWVHVLLIEDGKIVSYDEYIDSALVAATLAQ